MLASGLTARGHDVTLFAHPESASSGRLVPWPGRSCLSLADTVRNSATLARTVAQERFDVVHSFARIAYLTPILPLSTPKIMSYQREISARTVGWGSAISRGTLRFTATSACMMRSLEEVDRWTLIPNGVPIARYDYCANVAADAPLVFLGRIEEIKGPHLAIDIAHRSGRRLVIAGNIPEAKRSWAEANVLAHVDGVRVRYVGPVDDTQKNALLGGAAALLMPILWEEPFGIVMAEAMACGTPVLGLRRGAVPEVVVNGVTGVVAEDVEGLVSGLGKLDRLDRAACRARAETLYSDDAVVSAYIDLYCRCLNARPGSR